MIAFVAIKPFVLDVDVPTESVRLCEARAGQPGLLRVEFKDGRQVTGMSSSGEIPCGDLTPLIIARIVKAFRASEALLELRAVLGPRPEDVVDLLHTGLLPVLQRLFSISAAAAFDATCTAGFDVGPMTRLVRSMHEVNDARA